MKTPALEPPRRFYKAAGVAPVENGHAVQLDGRTPKSPQGRPLVAPTEGLARLIAGEWEAQGERIIHADMPATRLAFTALDSVPGAREAVAQEVADYAGSDALCYRATHPSTLIARQAELWDPLLQWSASHLGAELRATSGVIHVGQDEDALVRLRGRALAEDDFALAGLAFATSLFGSAVLAFAVREAKLGGAEAFELSRLEEIFQESQWGVDAEAAERTARLARDADMVGAWFAALR